MDEINEFRLFLIQNNALESYLKNVDNNRINQYYSESNLFCRIIDASFVWYKTPEGGDYWLELHRKWMKQVNTNCKVDYTNIVEKLLSTGTDSDNLWAD